MALTIEQKKIKKEEIRKKLSENPWCLLADPKGMTVAQLIDLRTKLREKDVVFTVYKNKLIKRAIEDTGDKGLLQLIKHLKEPTGVAITTGDPIIATKVFTDYAKENDKIKLKAVACEGDYWDVDRMKRMAELGSKKTIYAVLVSQLQAPLMELIFTIEGPMREFLGTLQAIEEKSA